MMQVAALVEESALSDAAATHSRNEEYTFQVPTPPRMLVPPPSVAADSLDVDLGPVIASQNPDLNVDFLNDTVRNRPIKFGSASWEYQKRREAQDILPFLYLGPSSAAKDREFLTREGITMILGVQPKTKFGALMMKAIARVAVNLGLEIAWLEANDNQDLIHELTKAISAINAHLAAAQRQGRTGKVLVFCESGNERSATVVAAYLMETFADVDVVKAVQICGSRRFCCGFDDNTKHLLLSYEAILQARRSVAQLRTGILQMPATPMGQQSAGSKRVRVDDDEDVDMYQVNDDEERFIGRYRNPFH